MAAPIRNMLTFAKHIPMCCRCANNVYAGIQRRTLKTAFVSLMGATVVTEQNTGIKIIPPSPETLTHSYLIKNASRVAVDVSSTVLSRVVASIVDTEQEYVKTAETLRQLLELNLQIVGNGGQIEDNLWDDILHARHRLSVIRITQQELSQLYSSVQKLVEASGEVAFFAGADYATTSSGERLYSADSCVNQAKAATQEVEKVLQKMEVKVIEVTARKAEEAKAKVQQEQTEDSLD